MLQRCNGVFRLLERDQRIAETFCGVLVAALVENLPRKRSRLGKAAALKRGIGALNKWVDLH